MPDDVHTSQGEIPMSNAKDLAQGCGCGCNCTCGAECPCVEDSCACGCGCE